MKKSVFILLLFTVTCFSQKPKEKVSFLTITQKEHVKKNGYTLLLKNVDSDSRCPEGVNCVWSGEVKFTVSVYKNGKFFQGESLSSLQREENLLLFSKYLAKKVKRVAVMPYPKEGVTINPKKYYLRIGYVK